MLLGGEPEAVASITDAFAPGEGDPLPVRIYRPAAAELLPLLVYAHGGGWVTGSLDSHDRLCRILANRLRVVLVAVAYRCAPEYVYPAALDDLEAAWRWARGEAKSLGADGMRFAVAGDSSGGNLAAALTLRLRSDGAVSAEPAAVALPCARCDLLAAVVSRVRHRLQSFGGADGLVLGRLSRRRGEKRRRLVAAGGRRSVGPAAGGDRRRRIRCAARRRARLRGEARAAGIPVRVIRCTGMIHGFLRWTGAVPAAHRWIDAIADAGRAALGANA